MNTKLLIGVGVLCTTALVGTAALLTANAAPADVPTVASALVIDDPAHTIGDIDIFGGKVAARYTVRNTGAEPVSIVNAVTSCMCTTGTIGSLTFGMHGTSGDIVTIPAGGSETLTATFDPLAHGPNATGPITRELILQTNSSATPEVRARLDGTVVKRGH